MKAKPTQISLLKEYIELSNKHYPFTKEPKTERLIHLEKCFLGKDVLSIALSAADKLAAALEAVKYNLKKYPSLPLAAIANCEQALAEYKGLKNDTFK